MAAKLEAVQQYLNALQYNHTGTQFFSVNKRRPVARLMETAKEIIRESLPIKCLEAVVVAIFLTMPLDALHRFTISFKSEFGNMRVGDGRRGGRVWGEEVFYLLLFFESPFL